jgi:hypothetical protein
LIAFRNLRAAEASRNIQDWATDGDGDDCVHDTNECVPHPFSSATHKVRADRPIRRCVIDGCKARVIHLPRHLVSVHRFTNECAKSSSQKNKVKVWQQTKIKNQEEPKTKHTSLHGKTRLNTLSNDYVRLHF